MTEKICVIHIDDRIFCVEAVLKASYLFIDKYYIKIEHSELHTIDITMEGKNGINMVNVDKDFSNELIAQMVRYDLMKSNKAIKELILGRALYSTCIDTNEPEEFCDDDDSGEYSIDDIAVDWFEKQNDN